jgi:hypothetical protein
MHGLTAFKSSEIIEQARQALEVIEQAPERDVEAYADASVEAVKIALENQIRIADVLEKIKIEFDKFEDGLSKIL